MRKTKTTLSFRITIELPVGSNTQQLQQYIRNAIASYGGGFEADHPLFDIKDESFTVALVKKETEYA